jgi:hypothetical protein
MEIKIDIFLPGMEPKVDVQGKFSVALLASPATPVTDAARVLSGARNSNSDIP